MCDGNAVCFVEGWIVETLDPALGETYFDSSDCSQEEFSAPVPPMFSEEAFAS